MADYVARDNVEHDEVEGGELPIAIVHFEKPEVVES